MLIGLNRFAQFNKSEDTILGELFKDNPYFKDWDKSDKEKFNIFKLNTNGKCKCGKPLEAYFDGIKSSHVLVSGHTWNGELYEIYDIWICKHCKCGNVMYPYMMDITNCYNYNEKDYKWRRNKKYGGNVKKIEEKQHTMGVKKQYKYIESLIEKGEFKL